MGDPKRSLKKVTWNDKLTEVLLISPREEKQKTPFLWTIVEESSQRQTTSGWKNSDFIVKISHVNNERVIVSPISPI